MDGNVSSLGVRVKLILPTMKRLFELFFSNSMVKTLFALSLLSHVRFNTWESFPQNPDADEFLGTSKIPNLVWNERESLKLYDQSNLNTQILFSQKHTYSVGKIKNRKTPRNNALWYTFTRWRSSCLSH